MYRATNGNAAPKEHIHRRPWPNPLRNGEYFDRMLWEKLERREVVE